MFRNIITLCVSFMVSLLLAEAAIRLVFDPIDYLAVETEADPVLNHRIRAGASGHDDWGYRNADIPETAEILAIGDSMTYGIMAKSTESWPARLQELSGNSVYNAALGGYGPLQYLHILKTRAPELTPRKVIVMLYMGNDLMDAYNLAYANENWATYRNTAAVALDEDPFLSKDTAAPSVSKQIRNWLARTSVLYRLVTQSALFDSTRERERLDAVNDTFAVNHLGATLVLEPARRLKFADLANPAVEEGLALTERALQEIAEYCKNNGISLHVALMPVREHVFFKIAPDTLPPEAQDIMQKLARTLDRIEARLETFMAAENIVYTNLLPVMQEALRLQNIYPPTDGHPNATGYNVVATQLASALNK